MCYQNNESAYHAQKEITRSKEFTNINASTARQLSKTLNVRDDWLEIRDEIMLNITMAKFEQHDDLRALLLNTRNKTLVHWDYFKDRYWGVYKGKGQNELGNILMEVRTWLNKDEWNFFS